MVVHFSCVLGDGSVGVYTHRGRWWCFRREAIDEEEEGGGWGHVEALVRVVDDDLSASCLQGARSPLDDGVGLMDKSMYSLFWVRESWGEAPWF